MLLSRKWLDEFVHVDANDKDFAEAMTLSGSKVETTEDRGAEISNIVVGTILTMERHPDSDHMWICQLDVGQSAPIQIVTGAWNIHPGDMVPVALDHSTLPGGKKIEKALNYFNIDPTDLVVMDVGASTGGFTDCLLRRGARKVYSIDVGYGQLAWSLRQDPRVKCMERTNIRYVTPDMLEETPSLCVIDVSFISLKLVLPVVSSLLTEDGHVANLIKPQFEAGKGKVGKKGVVREPEIHLEVLQNYVENAHAAGFKVLNVTFSPIKGPEGNIEFLGYLAKQGEEHIPDLAEVVRQAHEELDAKA